MKNANIKRRDFLKTIAGGIAAAPLLAPVLSLFPVKDGYITIPDIPGLGIDPDPADIKKYRVN